MSASLLAVPEGARHPEVLTKDDGSIVLRWFEPQHDSNDADLWTVTLSADRRTVDVKHESSERPTYLSGVLETLQQVLKYQSGVNVNITLDVES